MKYEQILEVLADKLGTTIDFLWSVLIYQQFVDAVILSCITFVVFVVMFVVWRKFIPVIQSASKERNQIDIFSDWGSKITILFLIEGVLSTVFLLVIINAIRLFLNPEFFALREILGKL